MGDWVDEWGTEHSIDSESWNENTITHYDNHDGWAVAQNSDDDQYSPGLWSKYDWTWESEELYYCQSTSALIQRQTHCPLRAPTLVI